MSRRMGQRPRAIMVDRPPIEPPPTFGRVYDDKSGQPGMAGFAGEPRRRAGLIHQFDRTVGGVGTGGGQLGHRFQYIWQDLVQRNPAHEQPKLIFYSGAQPIIRWGHRRIVRTMMAAGPRFLGRWAYVGFQVNQFASRNRMTGVTTRQGTTYVYPRFGTAPRTIPLGQPPANG